MSKGQGLWKFSPSLALKLQLKGGRQADNRLQDGLTNPRRQTLSFRQYPPSDDVRGSLKPKRIATAIWAGE